MTEQKAVYMIFLPGGFQVLGELVDEKDKVLYIKNPQIMVPTKDPRQVAFADFAQFAKREAKAAIPFNTSAVISWFEVAPPAAKAYYDHIQELMAQRAGIVMAPGAGSSIITP